MKARYLTVAAIAAVLAAAGCSSGGGSTPQTSTPPKAGNTGSTTGGDSGVLDVWLMTGEISAKTSDAVTAEFHKKYPNVRVAIEIQQWGGIAAKLTTALASDNPPDVMEIGNTDVPEFAASGGLLDLTGMKGSLDNSDSWLSGLEDPATVDGKLYGIPLLAGDRAVIYNKKMWSAAGITTPPTSLDELKSDLDKIKAKNSDSDFSALYLPGMYWYAGLPMIWDNGGDIAKSDGGKWTGTLSDAGAQAGLQEFKDLQNGYSTKASQTVNTNKPDQDAVMGMGKAATIIGGSWEPGSIVTNSQAKGGANLTADDLGSFCFPSKTAGQCAPVFLGGSDIAISAGSKHADWAKAWITAMVSTAGQTAMQQNDGLMPNAKALLNLGGDSAWYQAAKSSKGTPASPGWAKIEGDSTMENLFSQVASGSKSVADAAKSADDHLNDVLNSSS